MSEPTYHIKLFNEKVRVLNQTSGKAVTLTAAEARQLQADIFDLLTKINDLVDLKQETQEPTLQVNLQGGKF